jgi:hypothetical protein
MANCIYFNFLYNPLISRIVDLLRFRAFKGHVLSFDILGILGENGFHFQLCSGYSEGTAWLQPVCFCIYTVPFVQFQRMNTYYEFSKEHPFSRHSLSTVLRICLCTATPNKKIHFLVAENIFLKSRYFSQTCSLI